MPNPPSVFISYRRKSSVDLAQALHGRLKEAGVDVFFDLDAISGGEDYELRLEDELERRDCLLVILAPETLEQSKWVQREIATALRRRKKIIPVTTGGYTFSRENLPSEIADLARYNYIVYEPRYANAALDAIKRALGITVDVNPLTSSGVGTRHVVSAAPEPTPRSGLSGAVLTAIITGIFAVIVALIGIVPKLIESSSPTPTLQPTANVIAASPTPLPLTSTFTPTDEPSLTPIPPSETPPPTDVPTPIPPSPLPAVSISVPTVVLPNTTILVTAWQNAHCIFTPDDGNIPFGFDTSTGNIQYSVKHKAGTTVSIVCEDVLGRHTENQFVVSAVIIPTSTITLTFTNTPLPPTTTNTPLPPTSTFTLIPFTPTVTPAPPTPTAPAKLYPCKVKIIVTTGVGVKMSRVVHTKAELSSQYRRDQVRQGDVISILSTYTIDRNIKIYPVSYLNDTQTGYIEEQYIDFANNPACQG